MSEHKADSMNKRAEPEPAHVLQKDGIDLIAAERRRQISVEGWTPEHDDRHYTGELANAAACYAMTRRHLMEIVCMWPFEASHWKPATHADDRIRDLEKAGALIAAEIDRLLRKSNVTQ